MNKAKQLVIANACGFAPDHELVRDALAGGQAAAQIKRLQKITKADVLSPAGNGRSFFEYQETWDNFDRLADLIRQGGEQMTGADITTPLASGDTLLELAVRYGALQKVFSPEIWKGQIREMENAWFSMPSGKRDRKIDFQKLRRNVAREEGRELREDILLSEGISVDELRDALQDGDIDDIKKKLAQHGDHLRKEDLFILDIGADNMMESRRIWNHFGAIHAELERNGERLEVEDYLRKCADRKSPLEFAVSFGKGKEIFNASIWQGRRRDMLALYAHVPPPERKSLAIEPVLDRLAAQEFASNFKIDAGLSRSALTTPLNESDSDLPGYQPVRPLGQKIVWEKMDEVRAALRAGGEKLTQADLRQTSGYGGETCQMLAARCGKFDQVLDILRESGEKLSADDLAAPAKDGSTIAGILADKGQLGLVMKPEQWVGRRDDMIRVRKAVPEPARKAVDIQSLLGRLDVLALRRRYGGGNGPAPAAA